MQYGQHAGLLVSTAASQQKGSRSQTGLSTDSEEGSNQMMKISKRLKTSCDCSHLIKLFIKPQTAMNYKQTYIVCTSAGTQLQRIILRERVIALGSQPLSLLVRGLPAMINTQHQFVADHTPTL